MSVIDNMKTHFSNKDVRTIEVNEWGDGDNPLVIYVKPFTLAEQKKLYNMSQNDDMEMLAYTLIMKALDKEGEKIFNLGDKQDLLNNVDPFVLADVVSKITESTTVDDHLGN